MQNPVFVDYKTCSNVYVSREKISVTVKFLWRYMKKLISGSFLRGVFEACFTKSAT